MVIAVNSQDWKSIFKEDMNNKLKESRREFDKYKSTGRVVYLQQAGNKLFSVVENWLMVKYDTRVANYVELRHLVKNNKNDSRLLSKVAQLHYFYYENKLRGEPEEYEDIYSESYEIMKRRINR
jgi:hypothetical protein